MTIQREDLISGLSLLGLGKDEALIYVTLAETGPRRVWDIAKKSGLKRPTCYVILQKLLDRGFVFRAEEKKHVVFGTNSAKILADLFEQNKSKLQQIINELLTMENKSREKPVVKMFEGVDGIREAYNMTLDLPPGSEILFYSRNEVETKFPDFFHEYLKERVNRQIKARGIYPDNAYLMKIIPPRDRLELRKSKFIPKNIFDPQVDSTVFGNKVLQIVPGEKTPFATVTESLSLAADERQRFELLWQMAKEPIENIL